MSVGSQLPGQGRHTARPPVHPVIRPRLCFPSGRGPGAWAWRGRKQLVCWLVAQSQAAPAGGHLCTSPVDRQYAGLAVRVIGECGSVWSLFGTHLSLTGSQELGGGRNALGSLGFLPKGHYPVLCCSFISNS